MRPKEGKDKFMMYIKTQAHFNLVIRYGLEVYPNNHLFSIGMSTTMRWHGSSKNV